METLIQRRSRLKRRLQDFRGPSKDSPIARKIRKAIKRIDRKIARGKTE